MLSQNRPPTVVFTCFACQENAPGHDSLEMGRG
jgi:hypothetical protein